ncbi:IRK-interacting protein [Senna tora]|uniref:IRK-interacting protein n=1 Tax=Senna tora TaxID=362788 RepID=A0A834W5Y7_9FABA|nr:IRK-interacting protein [Senna tora]
MAAAHNPTQRKNGTPEAQISRQEIQSAISKAVELRALHAALMQANSPSHPIPRFPSPSRSASHFSAQDYPVFTPSYEEDPIPGYHQNPVRSRTISESWDEKVVEGGIQSLAPDYKEKSTSRKGLTYGFANLEVESHVCPADDAKSVTASTANNITVLQTSPANDYFKSRSRRNSLEDIKSVSSCNKCRAATITSESDSTRNRKGSNIVVPLTDSHSSLQSQPKGKGVMSWLFPRLKKKHKNENSPSRTESEEVSQVLKDLGIVSIETLKKELTEANENRDAALMEASELKSSMGDLRQKLEYLERYCEELKKALRQAMHHAKDSNVQEKLSSLPKRGKSFDGNGEKLNCVSEEAMVEGFLQIVSESRSSVKQFCKTLISQIEESDHSLMDNLNVLLQPYKLSLNSKYSKAVLYHFEAFINQCLYQDFENSVFQKNGAPRLLDPQEDRQAQFSSFVALRNLSWNEVLRKGTRYYSEEFSKFCDQKMSSIITSLNWTRAWPEQLLQAFFVAAKCIWLLHLLAFSFNPALGVLRVQENTSFDSHYMEDMLMDNRQRCHGNGPSKVRLMVMPGFYVQDRVLRCKVLCRYKSAA